jgi:hypothetical protein
VFANRIGLGVQQMEDIILVTGCHIARSWVHVAFPGNQSTETVSFRADTDKNNTVYLREGSRDGGRLKLGPRGGVSP